MTMRMNGWMNTYKIQSYVSTVLIFGYSLLHGKLSKIGKDDGAKEGLYYNLTETTYQLHTTQSM